MLDFNSYGLNNNANIGREHYYERLKNKRAELEAQVQQKRQAPFQPVSDANIPEQAVISFRDFAQSLFYGKLDPWQLDLCDRLQDVFETKGRRQVLIHIHPQVGKTILVSQRFPAYCIGRQPDLVYKQAMYNISHCTRKSGKVVRDLMRTRVFRNHFPDEACRIPQMSSAQQWSTMARLACADGQPSFMSLGLLTGFTGEGADVLGIDDPYPKAEDAMSDAYNKSLISFWEETAKVRLHENSKVIVMFHRYQVDDFAGYLLANEPDEWELWRYPAIGDEAYEVEETGKVYPAYPLGRVIGSKLSPRKSDEWYRQQAKNPYVWNGQFQGRPTQKEGSFFNVSVIRQPGMIIEPYDLPAKLTTVRCWDFAATEGGGARSAGVLMAGPDKFGVIYILDCVSEQKGTATRMRMVEDLAEADGEAVEIGFPTDPGSAGKDTAWFTAGAIIGHKWWTFNSKQDKVTRAEPLRDHWNAGMVKLVRGAWNRDFIKVFRNFPLATRKDEVDAAAEGYKRLARIAKRKKHQSSSTSLFD